MGKTCCCTGENEINKTEQHAHHHDGADHHAHENVPCTSGNTAWWKEHGALGVAVSILGLEMVLEYAFAIKAGTFTSLAINLTAYLLAGWNVLGLAFRKVKRGDVFNEFVLMSVATIGAFYIGNYSEGVAVMVFYNIGEWFQDEAVHKARRSIKALLDIRPDVVHVMREGKEHRINPAQVRIGETILVKPGEKVALDGKLLSDKASFNTAALTGESKPDTKYKGEQVLAGMIGLNTLAEVEVLALFKDSKLSQILEMVQDATSRKSQTQLFISRFAKVYTPIVFFLALALVFLPAMLTSNYVFDEWLYRGLVFLVISCPCALVVSIPLGYFGGIGLASRNGILFKGGNFIDVLARVDVVVLDKTGTLTKGVFKVQEVNPENLTTSDLLRVTAALEQYSSHPVAKAIRDYAGNVTPAEVVEFEEITGYGLTGWVDGKRVLAGTLKLLEKFNIAYPAPLASIAATLVAVSVDDKYAGYIAIADEIKEDAAIALQQLQQLQVGVVMLSGDKQLVVNDVARQLGIKEAYGALLPEDKVAKVAHLKSRGLSVAFVGDGVNDAPVIALADAGMAMGGLGSDAAIETADIVIQNDQPSKIATAIKISQITRAIVWQNIVLAMSVKLLVLSLGAGGLANLWEAVIADVGVALLAILNAVRIQQKQF